MLLYHFHTSPYARRIRLMLALKGLQDRVEMRDPRKDPQWWPVLHELNPMQTVPTLVDGERVFTDSLAIAAHLDAKAPDPPIFPADLAEALEYVRLADRAIDTLIDLALRYYPVPDVARTKMVFRAHGALDRLDERINRRGAAEFLVGDRWSIADIAMVTLGLWLTGMPARVATFDLAKKYMEVGWKIPPALAAWTEARRNRPDVALLVD
jgi:glutathione S-transferase